MPVAITEIQDIFAGTATLTLTPEQLKLEEKFQSIVNLKT